MSESYYVAFGIFWQLSVTLFRNALRRPKSALNLDVTQHNYIYSVSATSIAFDQFFLFFSAKQH